MKPRTRLAAVLMLTAGGALVSGQAPAPPPPPQTPNFKIQVEYVEVDTLVTDRNGNLVRDLKKDDFQVFEDGKAQTVSAFSIVDIPVERYERPLYSPQPIEPDIRTNERPFDGRMYVALIDDLHTAIGRTPRVRAAARTFIEQRLGANDLMAVVHTAGSPDASQDFTNNKRLLLAAVDRTVGRGLDSPTIAKTAEYYRTVRARGDPVNDPDDAQRAEDARRSLNALRDISQFFAGVHNRRKSILFFSEGIDYNINNVFADRSSMLRDTLREAVAAASAGNVSIYGIDPRGLTAGDGLVDTASFPDNPSLGLGPLSIQRDIMLAQDSLRLLADGTGGFAVVNRNDFANAFDRIVRDNSTYYVLAYYPPVDKPGKLHSIDVRVARPGVTVRARKTYLTPKPETAADQNAKAPARNAPAVAANLMTPAIRNLLDSPMPASGVTLHVFAAPFKGEAPNAAVMLGIDVRGRDLRLNTGDRLTLSYSVTDAEGKVRGGSTDGATINLQPETKTRVAETGLRVVKRLDLPPGRYQLKVAADDSGSGSVGSVLYDLEVPDFRKGALTMSGLAIGSALGAAMPVLNIDEQMRAMLPATPVAARAFARNDEIILFAEVYDNEASKPHKVDIRSTVTTDDGKEMYKVDEQRDSTDLQGKGGGYGYVQRIPLDALAPGSYVLTVSARSRLGDGPTVQRQSQFTIGER